MSERAFVVRAWLWLMLAMLVVVLDGFGVADADPAFVLGCLIMGKLEFVQLEARR